MIFVDGGNLTKALGETEKLYSLDARIGDTSAMSADAGQLGDILLGSGRADEARKRYQQSLDLIQKSGCPARSRSSRRSATTTI